MGHHFGCRDSEVREPESERRGPRHQQMDHGRHFCLFIVFDTSRLLDRCSFGGWYFAPTPPRTGPFDGSNISAHRLHQEAWLYPLASAGLVFHASGETDDVERLTNLRMTRRDDLSDSFQSMPGMSAALRTHCERNWHSYLGSRAVLDIVTIFHGSYMIP